jgi:2-polyprenyl-6-methoxyphenol hydroxylase-like FAD-dependent oxidoreductase
MLNPCRTQASPPWKKSGLPVNNPDVIVVGAGIAGASIAAVLARGGIEVLLLERQRAHRDRVRGEYMQPWGVLEARALGLEEVIRSTQAVDARYSVDYDELVAPAAAEAAKSDRSTILPGVRGPLCASHPQTCQALAENAVRSGADLVWGAAEVRVQPGTRPSVTFYNGRKTQLRPRLVIGADGRASTVRTQSGIPVTKAPATHMIAGLLVDGASRWPDDEFTAGGVEGDFEFYVFPQGGGRLRLYTCHANEQAARWAGRAGAQRFVEAFGGLQSIPESRGLSEVRPAGPCGTFSGEQTWCDNPYAEGVVLAGDAGGYDDPVAGQGLSLAMRDVRQLSELLLASADWTVAALRPYGQQRAERLRRMRRVSTTVAALMTTFTDAGRARRDRFYAACDARREDVRMALGAISRGPDRLPGEAFTDQLHEALLA